MNRIQRYEKYSQLSCEPSARLLSCVADEVADRASENAKGYSKLLVRKWARLLLKYGDLFLERKDYLGGIPGELPAREMYRIENTKGELLEYQRSEGDPDYEWLTHRDINRTHAVHYRPSEVVHVRCTDYTTFYPYGSSLFEFNMLSPREHLRVVWSCVDNLCEGLQVAAFRP